MPLWAFQNPLCKGLPNLLLKLKKLVIFSTSWGPKSWMALNLMITIKTAVCALGRCALSILTYCLLETTFDVLPLEHWDSRHLPFLPGRIDSSFTGNDSSASCYHWLMSFSPLYSYNSDPLSTPEKAIQMYSKMVFACECIYSYSHKHYLCNISLCSFLRLRCTNVAICTTNPEFLPAA